MKKIFWIVIMALVLTAPVAAVKFVDIPPFHWAEISVDQIVEMGLTAGYPDGTFRGKKTVSRYELAQYLAKYDTYSQKKIKEQSARIEKLESELVLMKQMVASLTERLPK